MRILVLVIGVLAPLLCGGANVVQKTIQQSGGDYTSLSAWEAGRQTNCVTADSIEMAVIQGSWSAADTTSLTINGWTTDAARYIVITNSTSQHDGKRYDSAANAYRLDVTGSSAITVSEDFVRIYGLQVKVSVSAASIFYGVLSGTLDVGSTITIGNCIFTSGATANGSVIAIGISDADVSFNVYNCLIHGLLINSSRAIYVGPGVVNLFNCSAVSNRWDYYWSSGTATAYNCLSQDSTTDGFVGTWGGNYNCSDRSGDAPGANSVNSYEVTFVSETAGSEDYHITSANTSIIDVTSDQSGGLFSDDIDGVTRAGSWCIGADEYVAAGGASIFQVITSQ